MTTALPPLPPHLAERSRALNALPPRADGEFVLLWMHHAVRDHEQPALDAALALADALDRPVLVYQGLGGAHRFNADRHHAFILEGARDAAAGLAARGIRHVMWLPEDPSTPSPLAGLLARAAAFVCEDRPVPPFTRWREAWAARAGCLALAVDASCVVPMRASARRPERAFAFRQQHQRGFEARVDAPWPEPRARHAPWDGDPGFAPVDWARFDMEAALAACAIDHALPPVADTEGGSRAGYARWEAFKRGGLRGYDRTRNDAAIAPPAGVSRLSGYLHHGHVSPWRLLREARAIGGPGADKFIDELWTWRELAWHWCFHTPDPEAMEALPAWARATLGAHAGDRRPHWRADDALHDARSGERLWDLAQASLLRQGELHNNLRMTWGKALLPWSASGEEALRRLVWLNHALALDGHEPGSYGGLLWCLGLFDRPFEPEAPVLGTLRPRPVAQHAARLDLPAYAARVARQPTPSALVVGAGFAGASAARALAAQGWSVTVLDKGRGPGGRMSTRRGEAAGYDHGAASLRARDPDFARLLQGWADDGLCARWTPRVAVAAGAAVAREDAGWVGVPGMNALLARQLAGLAPRWGVAVARLRHAGRRWIALDAEGAVLAEADALVLAVPAPQARALLAEELVAAHADTGALGAHAEAGPLAALDGALDHVRHAPCWAGLLRLAPGADAGLGVDVLRPVAGPLAQAVREASKPGRADAGHWVLHAREDWSQAMLEESPEAIAPLLQAAFLDAAGLDAGVVLEASAHRWRYARPLRGMDGAPFLPGLSLALAGDAIGWRGDADPDAAIEQAWRSGLAAAGHLLRQAAWRERARLQAFTLAG